MMFIVATLNKLGMTILQIKLIKIVLNGNGSLLQEKSFSPESKIDI